MFRRLGLVCVSAAVALACAAAAQPAPQDGVTTVSPAVINGHPPAGGDNTATAPPTADPILCKFHAATTGSRLGGSKVCLRRSQWEDNQRAAREVLENSVRGSNQTNCTMTLANGGC